MPSKMVYGLIFSSILCGVAGQFSLKLGVSRMGVLAVASLGQLPGLVARLLLNPVIFLGLCLYAIGAFLWMAVLSRVDLSFAYPFVALNFVFILTGSTLFLHEPLPLNRVIGTALIVLGVLFISRQ
ncbi:MAG: EamA family transporter [Bacillota bacterium]|nr:EamA family transporter [Bacillota bacterium]